MLGITTLVIGLANILAFEALTNVTEKVAPGSPVTERVLVSPRSETGISQPSVVRVVAESSNLLILYSVTHWLLFVNP